MSEASRPAWAKTQTPFRSTQFYFHAGHKPSVVTKVEDYDVSPLHQQEEEIEVSITGFSKVLDTKQSKAIRIFWLSVAIVCTGLCIYQLSDRIQAFLKYPTTLDVFARRNQTIRFPSVTICPSLEHNVPQLQEILRSLVCKAHNVTPCMEIHNSTQNYNFKDLNITAEEFEDKFLKMRQDQVDVEVPTGHASRQKEFLKFNADYTQIRTFWGNCLVVTPKSDIEYRGPYTLIRIKIKALGAMFFLHNEGIKQIHDAYFLAELLNGRRYSNIRIGRKEYNFLNTEQYPCMSEHDVVKCRNNCIDQKLDKVLNCKVPFLVNSNLTICNSTNDLRKTFGAIQKFYTAMKSDECTCKRKCDETLFSVTTDVISHLNVSETHFNLYYPDNLHEIVYESFSYSVSALLSDVGGTFGFYLGFCVVTLVEIFDYVLRKSFRSIHHL